MKIKDLIAAGTAKLYSISDSPRLDTEILLASVLDVERIYLTINSESEVEHDSLHKYDQYLSRRVNSEPVAYIVGKKEFWGLELLVDPGVLCPRPETELIVEKGLEIASKIDGALSILDLGTGSGCIAIALGSELKKRNREFTIVCADRSEEALNICSKNIERNGLCEHLFPVKSDWCLNINQNLTNLPSSFDLITSNPPYLDQADRSRPKDLSYEPSQALFSDDSGLKDIKTLLNQIPMFLNPKGVFLCEIGLGQSDLLRSYICDLGVGSEQRAFSSLYEFSFLRDLAGIERVLKLSAKA